MFSIRLIFFSLFLLIFPYFVYAICIPGVCPCAANCGSKAPAAPSSISVSQPAPYSFSVSWTNGSGTTYNEIFWGTSSSYYFSYTSGSAITSYTSYGTAACCEQLQVEVCDENSTGGACGSAVTLSQPWVIGGGISAVWLFLKRMWNSLLMGLS